MKKTALILSIVLSLCAGSLSAQHYAGVRGGWGGGTARFTPVRESGYQWGLYSAGVSYKFYSDVKYVGAIQIDLQYMQRGYMYDMRIASDSSFHRTFSAIDLPIMWQPHVYLFGRQAKLFINLGVNFTYNLDDSKVWEESKLNGIYRPKEDHAMLTNRDNRFGYGLCGGAGLSYLTGRLEFAVEARYYFGFSDILKNYTVYRDNPLRSPVDNLNASLAVYYRLGKEGIRSAPTPGAALKMEQAEARRQAKRAVKQQRSNTMQDE